MIILIRYIARVIAAFCNWQRALGRAFYFNTITRPLIGQRGGRKNIGV